MVSLLQAYNFCLVDGGIWYLIHVWCSCNCGNWNGRMYVLELKPEYCRRTCNARDADALSPWYWLCNKTFPFLSKWRYSTVCASSLFVNDRQAFWPSLCICDLGSVNIVCRLHSRIRTSKCFILWYVGCSLKCRYKQWRMHVVLRDIDIKIYVIVYIII